MVGVRWRGGQRRAAERKGKGKEEMRRELGRVIKRWSGTSLVVQWLRLGAPRAGDLGLIPGQGAHMPQLKTWPSQINVFKKREME